MTLTKNAKKVRAARAKRPTYWTPMQLMDPATGELHGCLVPAHPLDQRLARERKYRVGEEYRLDITASRNVKFHRLAHAIGHLLVDNVERFRDMDSHAALKTVQLESGICCEVIEMDASPVIAAVLDACEELLGKGARKVLAGVLPIIKTIPVKQAQSLAFDSMAEDEFANFFAGITQWIGDHYSSVMLDAVRAEYWKMINGKDGQQPRRAA